METTTTTAPFEVLPATEGDLQAISQLSTAAFHHNPLALSYYIYSQGHTLEIADWKMRLSQFSYQYEGDLRWYKLVHKPTGQVAGFSIWQFPGQFETPEEEAQAKKAKAELSERMKKTIGLPPGTNTMRLERFDSAQDALRQKYVHPGEDFVLKMVAVSPRYQGQGGAKLLLKSGLDLADAAGGRVYLEATPQGRGMYDKYGWRAIDKIVEDVDKLDGSETHETTIMIREPYASGT